MRLFHLGVITVCALLSSGCTIPLTPYSASYDNVKLIKGTNQHARVDAFTANNSSVRSVSVRGHSLTSPYNADLVNYIETAFTQELEKAGVLDANSSKSITADVEQNEISANGASIGSGVLAATFTVRNPEAVLFQKRIAIEHQWQSSFLGAIAIPNAAESYPKMVEKLLHALFSDADFVAALKS